MRPLIERQLGIIDFTLSSLARRKGKHLALCFVFSALVFLLASLMLFTTALRREAALVLKDSPDLLVQRMMAGRHDLVPADYIRTLSGITGVSAVRGRLWGYFYDSVTRANYTLMVPPDFPSGPGTIVIGQGISRARAAYVGDLLPLRSYDGSLVELTIYDILSPDSELVSSDLMLISEQDFRSLFRFPQDRYTDLTLTIRNPLEIATVAEKIARLLPDTRPISRREILRTYESIFDWRSGIIVLILSSVALAFIIFALDRASGLSAEEKKEIGILKAVGWETGDVLWLKFWEGAVISLSSFFTGILLAYAHVFFTPVVLFEPVLKGWSVLYPQFRLAPHIDPYQLATLFFLTVAPYAVAVIIPAWRAATIDPDSVMRS